MAEPGEFTLRAFLNKKLDLTQAEAVADMISSNSEASLQMAIHQMRGGFSNDIAKLRQELIDFAALIELENDFGEEDVEFANRPKLKSLIESLLHQIEKLRTSFSAGNVLKNGINTVISGKPNAGKSTLLNALLNEERAIVSDVAGTTRDTIEEIFTLEGIQFRLIDTAGLRDSSDNIEQIGVSKAKESIQKADLIIYLFDAQITNPKQLETELADLPPTRRLIILANKTDKQSCNPKDWPENTLFIAAKTKNIDPLLNELIRIASQYEYGNETLVNNARHADALSKSSTLLQKIITGINDEIPSDLIAIDIRNTLYQLGLITGEVTNDEVLESIFTRFCIGK
jgi:tRNA modification GTPase